MLGAFTASACGHHATQAECEEILEISATLELRAAQITDPDEVRERTKSFRELRGADLLKTCVDKRITDRAMECIRAARSADEFDSCLD